VNSTIGNTSSPRTGREKGTKGLVVEPVRLAIVATHPIQYQSPWFKEIASSKLFELKVFFLWDFGVEQRLDPTFGRVIAWDVPLLEGFDYEFVPNVSRDKGTHSFWGLNNPDLYRRVKEWSADAVLLLAYRYRSVFEYLLKHRSSDAPLIFRGDSHRLFAQRTLLYRLKRLCIQSIFNSFSSCLYVGSVNKDYFIEHGVEEERLFFAPHAVERERFRLDDESRDNGSGALKFRNELGIPKEHRVALFVGKFEAKKAPLDLVDAFIEADLENVTLVFVGDGALRGALVRRVDGHKHIRVVSFKNQKQMPDIYRSADVLILPSVGSGETWGLVVNEAMQCGLAVICSNGVGAGYDLLKPGENGFVFNRGEIADLAQCLVKIFSNSETLSSCKQKSLEIIKEYSFEAATQGLYKACLEVVSTKQPFYSDAVESRMGNEGNAISR
jgi:glycosyltransferase involved in cell wall biosynthesis